MRLKRLELYGFKTFADATEFVFDEGITAIIGPNGSGKSNCADALLWVLAERRLSALRAADSSDVIFGGSERRRPLGYAEVSLSVDNADRLLPLDLAEVSITRRVYRNGDHEWRLNGKHCRRRDVVELFLDTGVGKTAFSVISQRECDAILSLNPEDRRRLLDEVAGIERYRTQRDETLRRLDDTVASLSRVGDLINELSLSVGPLEAQRAVAQQFLVLRERFERLKLSLQVKDYTLAQRRAERVAEELVELAEQVTAASGDLVAAEAEEQTLRLALTASDERYSAAAAVLHEAGLALERHESQIRLREERLASLATRLGDADQAHARRAALVADSAQQAAAALAERERLGAELAALRTSLDQHRESSVGGKQAEDAAERALSTARTELAELDRLLGQQRSRRDSAREVHTRAQGRLADLASRGRTAAQAVETAETQAAAAKQALTEALAALGARRGEHEAAGARVTQLERDRADLRQRGGELQAKLGERRARLRVLQDATSHYEGLFRGVKTVLQARDRGALKADYDVVAELLTVAPGCDVAIEAALGPRLQDLVCDSGDDARVAIELLKRERAGRATFLPLELIEGGRIEGDRARLKRLPGVVGHALDLVTCEPAFDLVRRHLLSNVVVVEDMEAALAVRRAGETRVLLVTQDGDLLRASGAMTGGSREDRGPALLSRKREQEELATEVESLGRQSSAAEAQAAQAKADSDAARAGVEQAAKALEAARRAAAEAERAALRAESAVSGAQADAGRLGESEQQLQADASSAAQTMAAAEAELATASTRRESLAARLQAAQEAWQTTREARRGADEALAHDRVAAARLESRLQALAEAEAQRARARTQADADEAVVARERAVWERERDALAEELVRLRAELVAREADRRNAQTAAEALRAERQELALRLDALDKRLRAARQAAAGAQEARHRAELRQTQATAELAHLEQTMAEDHPGLTLAQAAERAEPIVNRAEAAAELQGLRDAIAALGDVNVGAIDEYERVGERLDFYRRERDDLDRARVDLLTVMADIDLVSRERLAEAFAAVNREFDVLFKRVFGADGEAHLAWCDPDNFLESGLEVNVRLPGKRIQNLVLLSGGERAMTTITLLLSMFRVKPAPFCLLDELDAPLDEANLRKYRELLSEFAVNSQFIVITHNPETTRAADTLYGITMEEPGVSRAYSHRLPREQQEPAPTSPD